MTSEGTSKRMESPSSIRSRSVSKSDLFDRDSSVLTNISMYHILQYQTFLKNKLADAAVAMMGYNTTDRCQEMHLGPTITIIKYPFLYKNIIPRMIYLQKFLVEHIPYYREKCCAPSPQNFLDSVKDHEKLSLSLNIKIPEMCTQTYLQQLDVTHDKTDIIIFFHAFFENDPRCNIKLIHHSKLLDLIKYLSNAQYIIEMSLKSSRPLTTKLERISNAIMRQMDFIFRKSLDTSETTRPMHFKPDLKMVQELKKFFDPNLGYILKEPSAFQWLFDYFTAIS